MTATLDSESENEESNRKEILESLRLRMDYVDHRIDTLTKTEDVDDVILIRWVRTHGYLAGQYRKLSRDRDIDAIEEDLELLKDVTNVGESA